jgi:hypothetical protein
VDSSRSWIGLANRGCNRFAALWIVGEKRARVKFY